MPTRRESSAYARDTTGERIGRLEVSVEGLQVELHDFRGLLEGIQSTVSKSRETDWKTVMMALTLIGVMYAAAIHPLQNDINRQEQSAVTLAQAVLIQTNRLTTLEVEHAKTINQVDRNVSDIAMIRSEGSPVTDKRLTVLEFKLGINVAQPPTVRR